MPRAEPSTRPAGAVGTLTHTQQLFCRTSLNDGVYLGLASRYELIHLHLKDKANPRLAALAPAPRRNVQVRKVAGEVIFD